MHVIHADDGRIKLINYLKYLVFNNGPLATTGCDRGAFINTRGERTLYDIRSQQPWPLSV